MFKKYGCIDCFISKYGHLKEKKVFIFIYKSKVANVVTYSHRHILAHQIEKSDVLPCIRSLLSTSCYLTSNWLYRTSRNFVDKRRHKNLRMTSVLIKMADVNVRTKMDLLKRWHPKVCKKKNITWVCGYVRQFCPSGHCLASRGSCSDPRDRIVYPIHKLVLIFRHMFAFHRFCLKWDCYA